MDEPAECGVYADVRLKLFGFPKLVVGFCKIHKLAKRQKLNYNIETTLQEKKIMGKKSIEVMTKWAEEKAKEVIRGGSDYLKNFFETCTDDELLYTLFSDCSTIGDMERAAIMADYGIYKDDAQKMLEAYTLDYIANYMDDDIREGLHSMLAPCDDLLFLVAYMAWHNIKYNEDFRIN